MAGFQSRFWLSTLAVSLACSALGGLKEREEDVKRRSKPSENEVKPPEKYSRSEDVASSAFGSGRYPSSSSSGGFMSDFWGWLVMSPFAYRHDDPSGSMVAEHDDWADESESVFPRHKTGQATVPYVRFDYNHQWAEDVNAHDSRLEAGYKFFAFHGRMTQYTDTTDFTLDVRQYYGVLRYGGSHPDFLPGTFEFNVGLGVAHHTGDIAEDDTSAAATVGLKYYPVEWLGAEFRPAWYRWEEIMIRDYDLSVSMGYRYLQLRGGYRWLWDQGVVDVQSGPYAGVSLSF